MYSHILTVIYRVHYVLRNGSPQCLSQLICSWILWNRVILVCQEIVLNLSCPNERVSTNLSATAAVYTAHEETVAVKTAPDFNAAFSVKRKPTYEQAGDMEMTSENDERDYTRGCEDGRWEMTHLTRLIVKQQLF